MGPLTVSSLTDETEEGGVECGSETSDEQVSSSSELFTLILAAVVASSSLDV